MSENYLIRGEALTEIADAVRDINGETEQYTPAEIAGKIRKVKAVIDQLEESKIIATATGESIVLTDPSDKPLEGLVLYGKTTQFTTTGKNLLNYDAWKTVAISNGTAVFENNGVTITATANDAYTRFISTDGNIQFPEAARIAVAEGDVFTLSWEADSDLRGTVAVFPNGTTENFVTADNSNVKELIYTVPAGVAYVTFRFGVRTAGNTIAYKNIQIEMGSVRTDFEPYTGGIASPNLDYPQDLVSVGDDGNVGVTVCGKNLFDKDDYVTSDVYVDVSNNKFNYTSGRGVIVPVVPHTTYTISKATSTTMCIGTSVGYPAVGVECTVVAHHPTASAAPLTITTGVSDNWMVVQLFTNADVNGEYGNLEANIASLQIELGVTATEYEPYNGSTLSVSTPNGLSGIPVTSGGNYTDENGQQWICDEIDFERGVYVQRIFDAKITSAMATSLISGGRLQIQCSKFNLPAAPDAYDKVICKCNSFVAVSHAEHLSSQNCVFVNGINIYFYLNANATLDEYKTVFDSNEVHVYYVLKTPIETPLSAEEIAAYKALHTNKPVTTILNDSGAEMSVSYVADTKAYIDNKFAALEAAILSTGGNL